MYRVVVPVLVIIVFVGCIQNIPEIEFEKTPIDSSSQSVDLELFEEKAKIISENGCLIGDSLEQMIDKYYSDIERIDKIESVNLLLEFVKRNEDQLLSDCKLSSKEWFYEKGCHNLVDSIVGLERETDEFNAMLCLYKMRPLYHNNVETSQYLNQKITGLILSEVNDFVELYNFVKSSNKDINVDLLSLIQWESIDHSEFDIKLKKVFPNHQEILNELSENYGY